MPKNFFQKVCFTFLTVIISVCAFVFYNVALQNGSMTNQVFQNSRDELLLEFPIAFLSQLLIAGPLSMKLAFRIINPSMDHPRIIVLTITFMTIAVMCPFMSFVSTVLYHGISSELFSQWLQAMVFNFPLAVFSQFFFIGPFVRLIFRSVFRINSFSAGLSGSLAHK